MPLIFCCNASFSYFYFFVVVVLFSLTRYRCLFLQLTAKNQHLRTSDYNMVCFWIPRLHRLLYKESSLKSKLLPTYWRAFGFVQDLPTFIFWIFEKKSISFSSDSFSGLIHRRLCDFIYTALSRWNQLSSAHLLECWFLVDTGVFTCHLPCAAVALLASLHFNPFICLSTLVFIQVNSGSAGTSVWRLLDPSVFTDFWKAALWKFSTDDDVAQRMNVNGPGDGLTFPYINCYFIFRDCRLCRVMSVSVSLIMREMNDLHVKFNQWVVLKNSCHMFLWFMSGSCMYVYLSVAMNGSGFFCVRPVHLFHLDP